MRVILVLFDSLSRKFLPTYGNKWVKAPNFERLAERAVTFEKCFVGSMPCIPARRELHAGRYNFLHRSWGPLEPFDDSMPEILKRNGVYTHLVSDHYHYWEDGGATYHTRYSSWEIERGQESDPWKGEVADPEVPEHLGRGARQHWVNRKYMRLEEDMPQTKVFSKGLDFIRQNREQERWFLQIECFDPHPPFVVPQQYKDIYPDRYDGVHFDWPPYGPVAESLTPEAIRHCQYEYAALVSMCDRSLGRVLDAMDALDLWKDAMLIVTTDHGFLLGEHGWWAFCIPPFYDEVANKPLLIWDPRCARSGERRRSLVQTHDLPATILEFFGVDRPQEMQGRVLRDTVASDEPVREAALFGVFGGHINCTDGRYVYMRAPASPENEPLHNYTLMPMHMRRLFGIDEIKTAELSGPFSFTKGCPLLRVRASPFMARAYEFGTMLFDLDSDPDQRSPIQDPSIEERMVRHMAGLMKENDAPPEQFVRVGLSARG